MKSLSALTLFIFCCSVSAEIETLRPLSFGTIAVLANNQEERYRISHEGNVNLSNNLIVVAPGHTAQFRASNLPPDQTVILSTLIVDDELVSSELNVERFSLESLDARTVLRTDENGEFIFSVGGVIATSGNGSLIFGSSPLSADILIEINY